MITGNTVIVSWITNRLNNGVRHELVGSKLKQRQSELNTS